MPSRALPSYNPVRGFGSFHGRSQPQRSHPLRLNQQRNLRSQGFGFRALGFQVSGFRVFGFRVLGFRVLAGSGVLGSCKRGRRSTEPRATVGAYVEGSLGRPIRPVLLSKALGR